MRARPVIPAAGIGRRLLVCVALSAGTGASADDADHFARCAACHLDDGSGVPGMFPPLSGYVSRFLESPVGKDYLARLVTRGASGGVAIGGVRYAGGMPSVVADLSDVEVAGLLNRLALRFAPGLAVDTPFEPGDIAAARAEQPLSGDERTRIRRIALDERARTAAPDEPNLHAPASLNGDLRPRAGAMQARHDWMLHCQGCHGARGEISTPGMPALRGRMAGYSGAARARLVRVPGVANSSLSDARIAATLNWMLATFDGERPPAGFHAFTGEEVAALRGRRVAGEPAPATPP